MNTAKVSDEEVKYTVDASGAIVELSKSVRDGLGEAIGINYIDTYVRSGLYAPASLPSGLGTEAAGEVQTPVIGPAAEDLRIGDTVWLRHAKAGEPAEHFSHYLPVQGEQVLDPMPTYRGEGGTFL